jgi:hypothetical protein
MQMRAVGGLSGGLAGDGNGVNLSCIFAGSPRLEKRETWGTRGNSFLGVGDR